MKGTLRDVGISLLGAAAAGSLILGLTRLFHPLGTQDLVAIWVVGIAVVCVYPLLVRSETGPTVPPGTVLVGTTGLLIFSNQPTDFLVVPACLALALLSLRTLPVLAPMQAPLVVAAAGALIDLTGGIFWITNQPLLKELSWWCTAAGGGLVFAGLGLAAGRATATRRRPLVNLALAFAALGVAGGWMAEAIWELIARVFLPYRDAYVATAFPQAPWIGTFTGASYIIAAVGMMLLMYSAKWPFKHKLEAVDGGMTDNAMRDLRAEWSASDAESSRPAARKRGA
ncbi:MAG: hypothetical protein GKS06_07915 [Acidobacteria bacterium]|nr:hypothetical protein [Acidobacteriota bacterium]